MHAAERRPTVLGNAARAMGCIGFDGKSMPSEKAIKITSIQRVRGTRRLIYPTEIWMSLAAHFATGKFDLKPTIHARTFACLR